MRDVLLHVCCAPCSIIPVRELRLEGLEPEAWFENPNIQPAGEYRKRLRAARDFAELEGMAFTSVAAYRPEPHMAIGHGPIPQRCRECYAMRMRAAAARAGKRGLDAFTTTLLYSPYQERELILQAGRRAAEEHGVTFLERDWREHYREGVERSRELGLYRQKYCGCLASLAEREAEKSARG